MATIPHSTAELRKVKKVQFGILSPEEIVSAQKHQMNNNSN
ncbi:hypothetical protein DFA_09468 [Cavenderia fasciculata]|uniref:Uncharacterized protein n=1 Tax=Cavenderia fasciculata TaxID=261658 RepID=F4Q7Q0_CACFS|nr:uncharacterized protein DFA_09468 [Cavenderia fasciculata]EGG15800.1 hypothetical protein DFA_09468 [Cavenderia fasciculata]|eukprot:XP_004352125.1 hypothetical protein DFA_09468 [Cavenderia fasciculata]